MKNKWNIFLMVVLLMTAETFAGVIVPGLDDSTALKTYTDAYVGSTNEITPDLGGQITLAARFNVDTTCSSGTYVILEVGGTSNGTGLYLCNGHVFFVSSTGSGPTVEPESTIDTDWAVISNERTIAVDLGAITLGSETTVYGSMDLTNGKLTCSVNGVSCTYTIANTAVTNMDGNESICFLSVGTTSAGWMGGLFESASSTSSLCAGYSLSGGTLMNVKSITQTAGYDNELGQIFSTYIPEPATLALLALGCAVMRSRKK